MRLNRLQTKFQTKALDPDYQLKIFLTLSASQILRINKCPQKLAKFTSNPLGPRKITKPIFNNKCVKHM